MENGIVQRKHVWFLSLSVSHNPCCNGRWSRTRTPQGTHPNGAFAVLILIVVDVGLVLIMTLGDNVQLDAS